MDSTHSSSTAAGPQHEGGGIFVLAPDGLRLHVREHGAASAPGMPVVCLPGLTRTTADFDDLARALAASKPSRRVIALDSRGRGRSALKLHACGRIERPARGAQCYQHFSGRFCRCSRGGFLTMLLAAARPAMIAGVVLHDIGPLIEAEGVARIVLCR